MSLNQESALQGANTGFGGQAAGQYDPGATPVLHKTAKRATTAAIARGEVITVIKTGTDKGKIRKVTNGDVGPFGFAWIAKALNDTRISFISQPGVVAYLIADGAIKPGELVKPSTSTDGQVVAATQGTTADDSDGEIVGMFISKASEVSKSGSGVYTPSDAADGDVIRVVMAGTKGEIF